MPWLSKKQERWGNSKAGIKAMGKSKVNEFNQASKGAKLPMKVKTSQPMSMIEKPSMSVGSNQMKKIKGLKVGSNIKMHVIGKVKGIRQSYDNPNEHKADIEIQSIKEAKSKGWKNHTAKG